MYFNMAKKKKKKQTNSKTLKTTETEFNLKHGLNPTLIGKVSAICPSLFYARRVVSPFLQFRYGLKHIKEIENSEI